MHPTILVQRRAKALNRIFEKADALIKHLDLEPALAEALQPKGAKDPQVTEMFRLEALADLFDQLAGSAGVTEPVTAVTDEEPESKALDEPGPVSLTEELPPPILDEETPAAAGEERSSSAPEADDKPEPVETEGVIEELPSEEGVPTEEVAAAEPEAEPAEAPAEEETIIEEPKPTVSRKRKSSKEK